MTRFAVPVLVAALIPVLSPPLSAAPPPDPTAMVERFASDPLAPRPGLVFFGEGDTASRFTFLGDEAPHFPGDRPGTLRVLYDTTLPTARLSAPIGDVVSPDRDFEFGAILTIRSAGFAADPTGFSQIAFGLWNARTAGLGRTLFPSDTYDLVEADYFANITDFGGPFLAPTVFGGNVGNNAFFNFAFQSTEVHLPFDTPLLVRTVYDATARRLTVTASRHVGGTVFEPIPGARVDLDLSRVSPGFMADVIGIAAYGEGWPSLRAEVDYDLLWFGPVPPPWGAGARVATGLLQP
jgi:hypothetical protein